VCGFGAGSIAMAKVQGVLLELIGLPMTFVTLGCSYFVIMVRSSFVLRTPPPGYSVTVIPDPEGTINNHIEMEPPKDQNQQTLKLTEQDLISLPQALSSRDFRLLYIAFLSNILFGLVLISRMSNMVTDIFLQPTTSATTAVSLNGAFNLFGRLFFSLSSDYVGRKNTYVLMLTTQLAILASFHFITTARAYPAFLATMWTLTMCYGGGFSLIPAFLADKFGPKNVGATHGVILTAWSIAGVAGGLIFTTVFNSLINSGEYEMNDPFLYNVNAYWILAVVGTGWTCILLVEPTERDRKFLKWIMCRN
jgi:Na+/melibiose symporter-like transporter